MGAPGFSALRVCPVWRLVWLSCATIVATILFLIFPQIDLAVASFFMTSDEDRVFFLQGHQWVLWTREVLQYSFMLFCLAVVLFFGGRIVWGWTLFGLDSRRASYLILCFGLGPGLLVNYVLKNHWGRARPVQITQFGGEQEFTPAWVIADQCERNCSFVSGEAAMGFSLLALALLAAPGRRSFYIRAVLGLGCFIGFLRMGVGGHFLSDVIFAGLLVSILTVFLHHVMIGRPGDSGGSDGPVSDNHQP